jgi:serine/threonine-protein kinase ULK/ATG1
VELVDTFDTTHSCYLVFEYCEQGDLEKYLKEYYYREQVPEETAQAIIYSIADAVALIHEKGIAHRDIKLANILLKKDFQIKLADFGFAKESQNNMFMQTYCGTPITMAPEIIQNKPYDKKVDIWSLGVITYQLVYGKLPFPISDGLTKFMSYVAEQPLEIPSQPPMSAAFK